MSGAVSTRRSLLLILRVIGAALAYGCFALFLALVAFQVMRWLRDGEWTHIGLTDGLRALLLAGGVEAQGSSALAALVRWLDTPVHWLGLHRLLELLPASLALFLCSIFGNFAFIYSRDTLEDLAQGQASA